MTTPLRQQYLRIKKQFPDVIVLFRLGDFYETFDDDARIVSSVCNIVLTGRDMGTGNRVPLAGVPYHAVETYLAKLIQAGHKVAIVEQSEPDKTSAVASGRALMSRDVTRVVTPGTVVEPALLQDKANNYLAAVCAEEGRAGVAFADITTGEFAAAEMQIREVRSELDRLHPAEVLIVDQAGERGSARGIEAAQKEAHAPARGHGEREALPYPTTHVPRLDLEAARQTLLEQFETASLDGFGLGGMQLAPRAAAAIVRYLRENQKTALGQLRGIRVYSNDEYMVLDPPTRRNLELVSSIRGGGIRGSLLGVLDETRTPMGGRLLRQWLTQPLRDLAALRARLDRVDLFYQDSARRERVRSHLKAIGDGERLTNRVVQGIATPRDLRTLFASLDALPALIQDLDGQPLIPALDPCAEVGQLVGRAIVDDPPTTLSSGRVIAEGYSAELDSINSASRNAKDWVAALERTERERTGIKSLRVGYNRVFGYYLEVTTPNLPQVPDSYIRKQTLANAERFITPELKEYESLILNAEERIAELESSLFRSLCGEIAGYSGRLLATARLLAELDVYSTLAEVAHRNRYTRPALDEGDRIEIRAGRHPVVELMLREEPFVPNDCALSGQEEIHIITGPNMSGKSTFLRQAALIVLMAQIGSFVPAESAQIGLVDRIFTRIGAEDAISSGQSTFMVEMVETANILNHCSSRSLVILDEIGRGTSTYDGIAIARAVVEYIHNHPRLGAKTLFATHYHELTELEDYLPKVRNYNVAVVEQGDQVVFMHKIVPGGADKSYGIHVAQLAGVPRPIVSRAHEILQELENGEGGRADGRSLQAIQLRLFSPDDDLRQELARLDVMALSPIEALNKLFELQNKVKGNDTKPSRVAKP
ncbi:MAG: DNA mismatch repair protein MutS [Rudaea sp.]